MRMRKMRSALVYCHVNDHRPRFHLAGFLTRLLARLLGCLLGELLLFRELFARLTLFGVGVLLALLNRLGHRLLLLLEGLLDLFGGSRDRFCRRTIGLRCLAMLILYTLR